MNESRIELTNYKEFIRMLGKLSDKEIKKAYLQGLRKAIKPLYKQTIENLKKTGINIIGKINKKTKKGSDTLKKDVKTAAKKYRNADNEMIGRVYIKPSGMLKWFEMGTDERKTKSSYKTKPFTDSKGRYYKNGKSYPAGIKRGNIKAFGFFESARAKKQGECMRILDDELAKSIRKIWESKK